MVITMKHTARSRDEKRCKGGRKVRRVNSKARRANIPEYSSLTSYRRGVNFSTINAGFNRCYIQLQYLDNIYFLGSLMQIICTIRMHYTR